MNRCPTPFRHPAAVRRWEDYCLEVARRLSALPRADRCEILAEITGHLTDACQARAPGADELEGLEQAIDALGDPDEFIHAWAAEFHQQRRAAFGDPVALAGRLGRAFGQSALASAVVIVIGLVLLFALAMLALGLAALFVPEAGLWLHSSGGWTLSFVAQTGAHQWRPAVFPWLSIVGSLLTYGVLARLVARAWHRRDHCN